MFAPLALKGQKEQVFAPLALKGQKLLAQGSALGFRTDTKKRPVRAKALKTFRKLLPLQGVRFASIKNPGRCPGLGAAALTGRMVTDYHYCFASSLFFLHIDERYPFSQL